MFYDGFWNNAKELHQSIYDTRTKTQQDFHIVPCAYSSLFQPFNSFNDLYTQSLVNPFCVFIANIMIMMVTTSEFFSKLCDTFALMFGYSVEWPKEYVEPNPTYGLIYAMAALAIFAYASLHALIDPLWEILATVTRSVATVGALIHDGAQDIYNHCSLQF